MKRFLMISLILLVVLSISFGEDIKLRKGTWTHYVPYVTTPPKVDGDVSVSEYFLSPRYYVGLKEDVDYIPENWKGPDDLSVVYYMVWDKNYLYIGAIVKDDSIVQLATGENIWQGDHLELWFDTDLQGDFEDKANNKDDFQLGISPGDFDLLEPEVWVWTPPVLAGDVKKVQLAAKKIDGGYTLEFAIPWTLLKVKPEPNLIMGFAFSPSDTDTPGKLDQEMMMSSAPGSSPNWGNPTFWGNLILVDPLEKF
jgi:hypothetical protein